VLRRRLVVLAVSVFIGTVGGGTASFAMPSTYSATTSLVVSPLISNPLTGVSEDVNIKTEREILGSREVAEKASETLGFPLSSNSYLLSQVDVAAPSGSQVLQVTVRADSPQDAADGADALAQAYLDFRGEGAQDSMNAYIDNVNEQLTELQEETKDSANEGLIETLKEQRQTALLASVEPGRIIGAATTPTSPSGPGLIVFLAGGAMAGLLLGAAGALARERLDPFVRSRDRLVVAGNGADDFPVISGDHADPEFWLSIADALVQGADLDEQSGELQVAVRAVSPELTVNAIGPTQLAVDEILGADPSSEESPSSLAHPIGRAEVHPSGPYVSNFLRQAKASHCALVLIAADSRLAEARSLVDLVRRADVPCVMGLVSAESRSSSEVDSRATATPKHARRFHAEARTTSVSLAAREVESMQ
jgi:capsular polysaccharide biosynthesis protein